MTFKFVSTNQFKKDLKRIKKQSESSHLSIIEFLEKLIVKGNTGIEKKYKAHKLIGNYSGSWEAHVKPDLLIIWYEITNDNEITLLRAGSHSELF